VNNVLRRELGISQDLHYELFTKAHADSTVARIKCVPRSAAAMALQPRRCAAFQFRTLSTREGKRAFHDALSHASPPSTARSQSRGGQRPGDCAGRQTPTARGQWQAGRSAWTQAPSCVQAGGRRGESEGA
jgi:hypothetical protein